MRCLQASKPRHLLSLPSPFLTPVAVRTSRRASCQDGRHWSLHHPRESLLPLETLPKVCRTAQCASGKPLAPLPSNDRNYRDAHTRLGLQTKMMTQLRMGLDVLAVNTARRMRLWSDLLLGKRFSSARSLCSSNQKGRSANVLTSVLECLSSWAFDS